MVVDEICGELNHITSKHVQFTMVWRVGHNVPLINEVISD